MISLKPFGPDPKPEKEIKEKKFKKIRVRSINGQRQDRIYSILRKEKLEECPVCEVKGCRREATEVHHKKGRGKYYLDKSTFLSVCHNHHTLITDHSLWAVLNGYSSSRLAKY